MSMKFNFIILLSALCMSTGASAVEIEAGGLRAAVTDTSVESLTVTGTMNAADFDFIASEMNALTSIDLSGVTIVDYSGEPVLMGQQVYSGNEIPAYAFMGMKLTSAVLPASLQSIGESAFASTSIASIVIPEKVATIGMGAFSNCDALERVVLPASVAEIGSHAWADCDNLTAVELGGVTKIAESTFARCGKLASVMLPATLTEIGDAAFSGCAGLTSLSFPASLVVIGNNAFEYSGLAEADLSLCGSLAGIGDWAFAHCENLAAVYFGESVVSMGEGAFFDDKSLVDLAVPMNITEIPAYMLKGTNSIDSSAAIHDDIESIGDYALMGWNHVAEMKVPAAVTYIGSNAMEGWTSLTMLDGSSLSEVPELGADVWSGVAQSEATLSVDGSLVESFKTTPQWKEFNVTAVSLADDAIDDATSDIYAYFNGYDLMIKAADEIAEVSLYDIQGRKLAYIEPAHNEAVIDTHGMTGRFFIVRPVLGSGLTATLKVVRGM